MKIKLLASSAVLAGALMASGTANAALVLEWGWTGTFTDWFNSSDNGLHSVVDDGVAYPHPPNGSASLSGDGDTTFTFIGTDFAMNSTVAITEWEDDVTGSDYYRVNVQNAFGLGATGTGGNGTYLQYNVSTLDGTGFDWAELDTDHLPTGTVVTKTLFDTVFTGPGFLTLTSTDGAPDSAYFGSRQTFNVDDRIVSGDVTGISNNYIPEPMSLSLFGLGLAALGYSRRRAA